MVEQKPSRPTIILFLSAFPLFSPAALLRGRSSLFPSRSSPTPRGDARSLPQWFTAAFSFRVSVFTKRRRRPWANVNPNREARTSMTTIFQGEIDETTSGNLVISFALNPPKRSDYNSQRSLQSNPFSIFAGSAR